MGNNLVNYDKNHIDYSKCYKILQEVNHGYVDLIPLLSHRTPVNILLGIRGCGKSTQVALLALLDFVINGHQFLYIRRRKDDVPLTAPSFFDNALSILRIYTDINIPFFRYSNREYQIGKKVKEEGKESIEWETCGFSGNLAKEESLKSVVLSRVKTIIYDEFISRDPNKYLGRRDQIGAEWDAVMSLYQSVDREVGCSATNAVSLFLMGNKETIYNPICVSLDVPEYYTPEAKIIAPRSGYWGGLWTLQNVSYVPALDKIKESFSYRLSSLKTQKYAYENESIIDNNMAFIRSPKVSQYMITLGFQGKKYGVRYDDKGNYYITDPVQGYRVLALDVQTFEDGKKSLQIVTKWSQSSEMQTLHLAFTQGRLFFKNIKIKILFLKYMQFMI